MCIRDSSNTKNNLLTLILSKADALLSPVLSPNNITPDPGMFAIGLTLFLYNVSLCVFVGVHASDVIPRYEPLLAPAGENHAALFKSVAAIIPAVDDDAGIVIN